MTKIGHIITGLYLGGAEMMLYRLLGGMDRSRFEPMVISLRDKGALGERIEALGIPLYTLDMPPGRPSTSALLRLRRRVREFRPDLVQGWMYHGNLAASLAGLLAGPHVPVAWGIHYSLYDLVTERPATRAIIRASRLLSRWPAATVYVSRVSAAQHEALGFAGARKRIIPNGFDGAAFRPDMELRRVFRAELKAGQKQILIGLIARYHPMKDHGNLLRAARILIQRGYDARLVLAGPGVEATHQELVDRIECLGLFDRVILLGERRNVAEIMAGLDILCMSSSHGEAFPMIVGEAMASGVPCVVTDVGDTAWLVGDTGRVVAPGNPEALAGALAELIDAGPEIRRRMGIAARQRILDRFSLASTVEAYQSLYEELLEAR